MGLKLKVKRDAYEERKNMEDLADSVLLLLHISFHTCSTQSAHCPTMKFNHKAIFVANAEESRWFALHCMLYDLYQIKGTLLAFCTKASTIKIAI